LGILARSGSYLNGAPLAIAVVVPAAGDTSLIDGARAIQDMMLVAWGEGIGSNWIGNVNTVEIRELLAVPRERQVLAIVPFGYPDRQLGKGKKKRKSLADVAHLEQYGRAYTT
jgi:nitroreductase